MISTADILAMCDVADQLAGEAADLAADDALALLEAVQVAVAALKNAESYLKSRAITTIEQPILVGHTAYSKVAVTKQRPDQALIKRAVVSLAASPDEEGEAPTAGDAAQRAVDLMAAMYVSPSTLPKVGGLRAMNLELSDVCSDEHTGWDLKKTELP